MCSYPLLKKEAFPEPRSTSPPLYARVSRILGHTDSHHVGILVAPFRMLVVHRRDGELTLACFEITGAITSVLRALDGSHPQGTDHAVPVNRRLFVWDEFVFWRKGGTTLYYIVLAEVDGSAGLTKRGRSLAGDDRRGRSERKKPHGRRGYTLSDRGRW